MIRSLICLVFGHDDPIIDGLGLAPTEEVYDLWKNAERDCLRCGKPLLQD